MGGEGLFEKALNPTSGNLFPDRISRNGDFVFHFSFHLGIDIALDS